jgi:hypothetical protein
MVGTVGLVGDDVGVQLLLCRHSRSPGKAQKHQKMGDMVAYCGQGKSIGDSLGVLTSASYRERSLLWAPPAP